MFWVDPVARAFGCGSAALCSFAAELFAGFVCFAVHGNFQQLARRVRSPDSFPHFRFPIF
jgi:hypothetical protein